MLYMTDQRTLPFYSQCVCWCDVSYTLCKSSQPFRMCASGLFHHNDPLSIFYCIWFINSSSPCWCTLYTSNKCPPGISPHSGRKGIATKLTLKLKSKRKEIATKLTLKLKSKRKGLATKITPKLKRKRKGIATKLTLFVRKRKQEKITRKTRSSERAQCKNATEKTAPICS